MPDNASGTEGPNFVTFRPGLCKYSRCMTFLKADNSKSLTDADVAERARINAETAKIAWRELQRFFAQGHAIMVARQLDLIDVAWEMSRDNRGAIEAWMAAGQVGQVTDGQAIEWLESDAIMWCVVVKPWVLVQALPTGRHFVD